MRGSESKLHFVSICWRHYIDVANSTEIRPYTVLSNDHGIPDQIQEKIVCYNLLNILSYEMARIGTYSNVS